MDKFSLFENKLIDLNFWDKNRESRNRFIFGIEPFNLSFYYKKFENLGPIISLFYKDLNKFSRLVSSDNNSLSHTFLPILKKGCNGYPLVLDDRIPPIIKVDILISTDDEINIVEIDGYNPRGIGYASLLNNLYDIDNRHLEDEIFKINFTENDSHEIIWFYPYCERFYLKSYKYLQSRMRELHGVNIHIKEISESNLTLKPSDYLFVFPWALSRPNEMDAKKKLIDFYLSSPNQSFFPMKPWFNNKMFLSFPFLPDKLFENLESLKSLKEFIPETHLIGKRFPKPENYKDYILKEAISSGHKGVFFSSLPQFENKISEVAKQRPTFILQKEVKQKTFELNYFNNSSIVVSEPFYCRFIAHYNFDGKLLNIDLTGRRSPLVYGSNDSIQIPCIH